MIFIIMRRLLQAFVVLLLVALVAFTIFRFIGDPVESLLGQEATVADRQALIDRMGLEDPIPVQYFRFVGNALRGDFGISYRTAEPVSSLIAERLPATLELAFVSALFAMVLGTLLGIYTAIYRDGFIAHTIMSSSLIGVSLPTFLIGVLLIWVFAVELGWLPSFGRGETVQIGFWSTGFLTASGLKSLILPAITLGLYQMTLIMRLVRAEMLEVLRQDFIRFARARSSGAGGLLQSRAEKYAGAGDYRGRPAAGGDRRLRDHHRDRVPVARCRSDVHQCRVFRRYPGDVGLPAAGRHRVRGDQSDRRSAVPRHRSAHPRRPAQAANPVNAERGAWQRFMASDFFYDFKRSPVTIVSFVIVMTLILMAVLADLVAPTNPFDPGSLNLMNGFTPPMEPNAFTGESFILGTDDQGRDLLSAIIYGLRVSLFVGLVAVILAMAIGVSMGLLAGYRGGWIDSVIMRIADIQMTFPSILIAVLIFGVARGLLPPDLRDELAISVLIIAIGLSEWVPFARTVRGTTMVEKEKEYVQAARLIGLGSGQIMLRHILPNVLSPVLVIATITLALAIIAEATLSFLGVGAPPTEPSLGTLIRIGQDYLFSGEWWILLFPAVTLLALALSVNLLGDWLRDTLNPRLK